MTDQKENVEKTKKKTLKKTKPEKKPDQKLNECILNCIDNYKEEIADAEVQERERQREEEEAQKRRYDKTQEIEFWYPYRYLMPEIQDIKLRTQGRYKSDYPAGMTIHWTAGRSRGPELAGPKYGRSPEQHAINGMRYAKKGNIACYLLMDRLGRVYQNFPLNEWGWHAGKSYHEGLGGMLSKYLVGIEVQNAGKLKEANEEDMQAQEKRWDMKLDRSKKWFKAWFTRVERGDWLFSEDEVRYGKDKDNCFEGYYHKFTELQEESLTRLICWMYQNGKGKFKINNVLGHDTIAKPTGRKVDPGHSMSRTIPEYQEYLKDLLK